MQTRRHFIKTTAATAAITLLPAEAHADDTLMTGDVRGPMPVPAPDWLRHAVIAEVPGRGFNVSNYKNPKAWAHPAGDTTFRSITAKLDFLKDMGFNVICLYSIYACTPGTNLFALRYDTQDPDLGTMDDCKELLHQAHARGMFVISNTNHYGVAVNSPLLTEHPDWFLPASQIMYSQRVFDINNKAARGYIVATHSSWCTEIGLDGWRIDSANHVFKQVLWAEILSICAAKGKRIFIATENVPLPGFLQASGRAGALPIHDMGNADGLKNRPASDPYLIREISGHNVGQPGDKSKCCAFNSPTGAACGREGCFKIKGSQFLYGYNSIFTPMVPWMLTGEVFNATHLALPSQQYNPKMLHSWLDWTDVDAHQDTVISFRKLAAIRTTNQDIFHNNIAETHLLNIPSTSTPDSPVKPYVRFIPGKKAALILGNNNPTTDITFTLNIPLEALGLASTKTLHLTDCLANTTKALPAAAFKSLTITVPKDKSPNGGTAVYLLTA